MLSFPGSLKFTAIVLAGDRSKNDELIHHANSGSKAMIDLDGAPMVQKVLKALRASKTIEKIILAGPEHTEIAKSEQLSQWIEDGELAWREPNVSPSTSAYEVLQSLEPEEMALMTTADHPLLTPEMVDAFARQSLEKDADVTVGLAPYALVQEAYPGIKKTVLRFSDGEFCGCNLFAFLTPEGRQIANLWRSIEQQRKKPLRVIGLLGWWAVLRYRLGILSVDDALAKLGKRLGLRFRVVVLPYANAAIDVDSIADLKLVKGTLS